MSALLRVEALEATRAGVKALDGVSFTVRPGEVVCVVGPAGSGKTTLVECLAGEREPDAGQIEYTGRRDGLAAVLQDDCPPGRAKVGKVIALFAGLYGTRGLSSHLIELLALGPLLTRRFASLTDSERRRAQLALALAGNPELVVLDEPTAGLRDGGGRRVERVIDEMRTGYGSACLTMDDLAQAERLADRVVLLRRGTVLAQAEPQRLVRLLGADWALRVPPHVPVGEPPDVRVLRCAASTYLYGGREALERAGRDLPGASGPIRRTSLRDAYLVLSAEPVSAGPPALTGRLVGPRELGVSS
ncbi:ATP-binding cassette domain-containing protein [Nonomuraea sp. 10N515B]|uniref:ATP-binding cassette domain-containing protein n=1 Tax=Nonomuraea sp. 10N515B TaxID=3457422 RepID=UPI003FCD352C